MTGPVEPAAWIIAPLVDNPAPNRREVELAREIVRAFTQRHGLMLDDLAGALALVRDGYTLEGHRHDVRAVVTVSRRVIEASGGKAEQHATLAVWRRWSDELHRAGLRPVGWPAVQRTHLAFGISSEDDPEHPERRGLTVVEADDRWALLELLLRCEAVPA